MFKNVTQSLKIANRLKDDSPGKRKAEKNKNSVSVSEAPNSTTTSAQNSKEAEATGQLADSRDENFLVRQSRKRFSKFVARLQNVRTLSALNRNKKDDNKSKVVKFKLGQPEREEFFDVATEKIQANQYEDDSDDDDDDAYVSASETFYDDDFDDEKGAVTCYQAKAQTQAQAQESSQTKKKGQQHKQVTRSYSEDELQGDKFILPEEQCDIPTFLHTQNCSPEVIEETRRLLRERFAQLEPDSFYEADYKRMLEDDWTVTRFLLRRRLNPKRTAKLMEECGKFRREHLMSEVQLWEFPIEFHLAGGLFKYAPDRVGNQTMYMRVKMYRRVPEISDVFKAFILCVLEQCDVACNGRGTAVIFDLSGAGLQNVDLGFLYWLLNSFRNYCPKGVSYILVYNLPWFLSATAKLAMTWMSETNRRALRFVQGKEIEAFIEPENLPDYLGGSCPIDYKAVPAGSRPAVEVCDSMDITVAQALKIKELFKEYLPENYEANIPPPPPDSKAPPRRTIHEMRQSGSGGGGGSATSASSTMNSQQHSQQADNHSQASSSTVEAGASQPAAVVGLVSQASKFIAA